MSIMSEYLDEYKEVLLRDNPGRNELWLANEHMSQNTFCVSKTHCSSVLCSRHNKQKTWGGYIWKTMNRRSQE
jgi:hypothetical protein